MSAALSLPLFGPTMAIWQPPVQRARRHPRYYQQDCFTKGMADLATVRSTLAVMATGTGKTFTASLFIKPWRDGRVLWLNERDNLVTQVARELEDLLQEHVYIEQADVRAPASARVVVGSLQSMCQPRRLEKFERDHFGLIIPDEAHHSVAPSYIRIFDHFADAKILGLTATPRRHDGKSMGLVFDEQCSDYQMTRGVADGYLVPLEFQRARRIDVSKLKARGEFSDDQIASVMGDDVLEGIIQDTLRLAAGMRGVMFFPRVDVAHVAAKRFNTVIPGCAAAVDGEQERDHKRSILAAHKRGDFLYACNVGVIEEGHDDAGIEFVGMSRPTKSWAKYMQWLGRSTRPLVNVDQYDSPEARRGAIAASTKPFGRVLDFVGNTGKHQIVDAVDALAGEYDTTEVKKRARSILDADERGDVGKALDTARRLDEAERREEAARLARVQAAKFEWKKVNPFEAMGIGEQSDVATALNRASEKQRRFLGYHDIDVTPSLTFDDAQKLIRAVKMRERRGLADFRQIKNLSKVGISAQRMHKGVARRCQDAIDKNRGWALPKEVIDAIILRGKVPGEEG